jgi:hypothetical protein
MLGRALTCVRWRQPGATPQDVMALLAWYDPDAMLERLMGEIGDAEGVSAAERERREPALEARILAAERVEEGLIEQSDIARRPDASPLAILGVVLSGAEAKEA